MPRSIAEKRKEFMTTLLGVMNRLDPTGANADIYEGMAFCQATGCKRIILLYPRTENNCCSVWHQ